MHAFAHYVQVDNPYVLGARGFASFSRLPSELQLRIIQCCNPATLFELMHVLSTIRDEAQKLFWADQGAWYRVNGEWLLAGVFLAIRAT